MNNLPNSFIVALLIATVLSCLLVWFLARHDRRK